MSAVPRLRTKPPSHFFSPNPRLSCIHRVNEEPRVGYIGPLPLPCRLSWLIIIMAVIFVISQFSSPHIIGVKRCKCDNVGSCLYFTPRCIKYIKSDTKARPGRGTLYREDTMYNCWDWLDYAGQGARQLISSHEKGLSLLDFHLFI